MSDVADRVKKIVVEHLGVEEAKVTDNASFIDDLGADNEKFEYIDRRFVDFGHEPLKFEYEALIVALFGPIGAEEIPHAVRQRAGGEPL